MPEESQAASEPQVAVPENLDELNISEEIEKEEEDRVSSDETPAAEVTDPLDDLKEEVQEEKVEPEEPKKFTFKTKIDGVEEEITLDEDTIRRDYQKWKASDRRFEEAAKGRKQALQFIDQLKDPKSLTQVLQALGHDPQKLAEEYLYERIQYEQMDPKDREILELKQRQQAFEEQSRREKESQQRVLREQQTKQMADQMQGEILESLKASKLPQSWETVWRMARQIKIHLQRGIDLDAAEAAEIVEKEIIKENRNLLSKMDPDRLEELLGEEGVKKLRSADLAKIRNPKAKPSQESPRPKPQKPARGWTTEKEFNEYMKSMK